MSPLTSNDKSSIDRNSADYFARTTSNNLSYKSAVGGFLPTPASSSAELFRTLTAPEAAVYTPLTPGSGPPSRRPSSERRQDEKEEREIFSKLEKPRVRYDVEVVTKLVVYTGIVFHL